MSDAVGSATFCKFRAALILTPLNHHFSIKFGWVEFACWALFTNVALLDARCELVFRAVVAVVVVPVHTFEGLI
jgi:hypothetical protein